MLDGAPDSGAFIPIWGQINRGGLTPKGNDDDVGGTVAGLVIFSGRRVAEAPSKSKSSVEIEIRRHQAASLRRRAAACGSVGRGPGGGGAPREASEEKVN